MASSKKSTVVRVPPEQVFAYVDEPEHLVEWLPGLMAVYEVIGSGAGQQMEWTHKMAGMRLHGQTVVVEHVPNKYAVHQLVGMLHGTFTYSVEACEAGTELTLEIEYSIPVPLLGRLAERLVIARNARELELALTNVKESLENQHESRREIARSG